MDTEGWERKELRLVDWWIPQIRALLVDTETHLSAYPAGTAQAASFHSQWAGPRVPLNFLARVPQGEKEVSRSEHLKLMATESHVAFKHC